jgi:arginine/lysine/ornithine decarboxylase
MLSSMIALQEFDVATRTKDQTVQLAILDRCKQESTFTAEDFVTAARMCDASSPNPALFAALLATLKALVAQGSSASEEMAEEVMAWFFVGMLQLASLFSHWHIPL